jgi:hypothetical protein
MNKPWLLLFVLGIFPISVYAQFTDFPIGFDGVPQAKLKGPVHTVLTIEQREEHVFSTVVDVYDLKGRLIETLSSNAGIEIHSRTMVRLGGKTICIYDAQDRLAKALNFTPEGQYTSYEIYSYDSQNRLTGTTIHTAAGKETGKRTYSYFPDKREVVATWNFFYEERVLPPMKDLLSYNEKGQWTKRTEFNRSSSPSAVITFAYDKDGNFIKASTCCEYTYAHSYTYKFDNHGNWIEQQNIYLQPSKEPNPEWMRKYRVITYYSDGEAKPQKQ